MGPSHEGSWSRATLNLLASSCLIWFATDNLDSRAYTVQKYTSVVWPDPPAEVAVLFSFCQHLSQLKIRRTESRRLSHLSDCSSRLPNVRFVKAKKYEDVYYETGNDFVGLFCNLAVSFILFFHIFNGIM